MIIVTQAQVPDELVQKWLQHMRDFDAAHTGCHFEIIAETDAPVPVREMVKMLIVDPALSVQEVYDLAARKKSSPR